MSQQTNNFGEDAAIKAGLSFLFLWIAPVLSSFLGLLLALFSPAHGLEWLHKLLEVWVEVKGTQQGLQEGTLWSELRTNYTIAFYFGVTVLALLLVVAALSLIAKLFEGKLAAAVEATAATIWLIPYWIYRVVTSTMLIAALVAMTGGLGWAIIQMFRTSSVFAAIFGGMIAVGIYSIAVPTVYLSFIVTLAPLYLCLRYVVPLGLMWSQPDGFAERRMKGAFAEGSHFPFLPS
jgi:hypothetical protein